jgi:chromosome condensin MukBEF MukE localization factor
MKKVYYANDYAATAKIGFSDKDIHDEIVGHTSNIKLIKVVSKRANELYKD